MKTYLLPLGLAFLLCSCNLFGPRPQYSTVKVSWGNGYAYLPTCKQLVEYQGKSFKVQGVSIPVPQLGGNAQIGGISVDPQKLNDAYQTTQILDTNYHSTCELLPALVNDKEKFQDAVQKMQENQNKLAQLALGLQSAQKSSPAVLTVTSTTASAAESAAQPPVIAAAKSAHGSEPAAPAEGPPAGVPNESVKAKAIKDTLDNWVAAYSKKTKAAVVNAPVKTNTALGIPPAPPPGR